jgi:hypothetical protein
MKTFAFLSSLLLIALASFVFQLDDSNTSVKINGVSLVNPHFEVDKPMMLGLNEINTGWVAVIPFGFSRMNQPSVIFDSERQWSGERVDGTREMIDLAHECGFKVMVKPHVWVSGHWVGEFDLNSEEDWLLWESDYTKYILTYAKLAQETKAEIFCIGTEYKIATQRRPAFWVQLAKDVKKIYDGSITYASNWDDFEQIKFWSELDYIGVDAYFPLAHGDNPDIEQIREGWKPVKQRLKKLSDQYDRPILLTEYGYQSANGALGNHWEVAQSKEQLNFELQSKGYEALYQELWGEKWLAGGFLWKWHFSEEAGGLESGDWTPQGKPATEVIAKRYAQ